MNSFNTEWIKTITKDEFAAYCAANHKEMSKNSAEAYYDSIIPPVKKQKDDAKRNEGAAIVAGTKQ